MFDLIRHPPHSPEPVGAGAAVSLVTHAALVTTLLVGTGGTGAEDRDTRQSIIETAIRYLLPPDTRLEPSAAVTARWRSEEVGPSLPVTTAAKTGKPVPDRLGVGMNGEMEGRAPESLAAAASAQAAFTIIDVDSVAERDPDSAAPAYPPQLQERGVEGMAVVRFVVDTTGRADLQSFRLVHASHPLFVASVREALPGMKFRPASIGARKVRQLVEIPFIFRIERLGATSPERKP